MKKGILTGFFVGLIVTMITSWAVTHTFTSGSTISSSEVNQNFQDVEDRAFRQHHTFSVDLFTIGHDGMNAFETMCTMKKCATQAHATGTLPANESYIYPVDITLEAIGFYISSNDLTDSFTMTVYVDDSATTETFQVVAGGTGPFIYYLNTPLDLTTTEQLHVVFKVDAATPTASLTARLGGITFIYDADLM